MGTKVSKPGPTNDDQVTNISPNKVLQNSNQQVTATSTNQRPPSGMPNPQEEAPKMTFLSVPSAVYIDDDSISSMSADTTLMTKSSTSSSTANLTSSTEDRRRYSLSTYNRGSSEDSTKASLPNLTTSGIQINIASASSPRDENCTTLADIQESPTPSALEISNASPETCPESAGPKILMIPPKIELDCDLIELTMAQSETKSLREKRPIKVKTPKSYFLESFQKRKKSFKNSSQKCSDNDNPENEFTDLEALNSTVATPEPLEMSTKKPTKKFWSTPASVALKAHKYVVEYPPKTLQWSNNMHRRN